MKDTTYNELVEIIEKLEGIQKKIWNSFHVSEPNQTIKDAREYGYISSSIKDLESIVEEMKNLRAYFFLKDE